MEAQLMMKCTVEHSIVNVHETPYGALLGDVENIDFICHLFPSVTNIYPLPTTNNNNNLDDHHPPEFQTLTTNLRSIFWGSYNEQTARSSLCGALSDQGVHHRHHHQGLLAVLEREVAKILADEEYLRSYKQSSTRRLLRLYVDFVEVHHGYFDGWECRFVPTAKSAIDGLEDVEVEALANKDEICSVCYERLDSEMKVKKLPCQHCFHKDCIVQWLESSHLCPICRFEMPV